MSEILSMEQLKDMASTVIDIPGFSGADTIKVRVRKPSLLTMIGEGTIPNHLLGVASKMIGGESGHPKKQSTMEQAKDIAAMIDLYCEVCLVEPKYSEFKEIITDEQKEAIFDWGTGDLAKAETFHKEEEIQSSNNDG